MYSHEVNWKASITKKVPAGGELLGSNRQQHISVSSGGLLIQEAATNSRNQ